MPNVLQKVVSTVIQNATIVTTAETLAAYSGRCEVPYNTIRAVVKGWALVSFGLGTTAVQLRLRRGNGTAGTQINVGANENAPAQAGLTDDYYLLASEQLLNFEFQDYSLTVSAIGATANSTVIACSIEVEMING